MNEHEFQELQEAGWRRKLTPAEEALLQGHLAARPELRPDCEAEAALTHLLSQVPDAPLASNFTAQVLQGVERELVRPVRGRFAFSSAHEWLRRLAPRLAWSVALVVAGLVIWKQYDIAQRGKIMAGLEPVLQASVLPDPKLLQDFDAIQQLTPLPPTTDVELLNALSQ